MNSIPAKPTRYNGTLYRSRLEASWAVFFDVATAQLNKAGESWTVTYEPFVQDREWSLLTRVRLPYYEEHEMYSVRTYNPDFLLRNEKELHRSMVFEVKPAPVSDEYAKMLRGVAFFLSLIEFNLVLAVGSLRDQVIPRCYEFPFTYSHQTIADLFPDCGRAFYAARNYRWDLKQE